MNYSRFYLFHIQFLGYRYHGWLQHRDMKTVQGMINKTCAFIFGHHQFKTLGCSRTDAKVSAEHFVFELFCHEQLEKDATIKLFNKNLPNDIRLLNLEETDQTFNLIQAVEQKEYRYLFAHGIKNHPFAASSVMSIDEPLDIEMMQQGCTLFVGEHNFRRYCAEPRPGKNYVRHVEQCSIEPNTTYHADFFPDETWFFNVIAKGFLRYQVRLMMGQLIALGKGKITLDELKKTMDGESEIPVREIAPSSGLILFNVKLRTR